MDYQDIIQDLSEHVERFDCRVAYSSSRNEKILKINRWFGDKPLGEFRRQDGWNAVGEICQPVSKGPATIVNVTHRAPNYIKSLEGETCENMAVLLHRIRCEAFRHNAKEVFRSRLKTIFFLFDPFEQQVDHSNLDRGFAMVGQHLIISSMSAKIHQPRKRALDDPTAW